MYISSAKLPWLACFWLNVQQRDQTEASLMKDTECDTLIVQNHVHFKTSIDPTHNISNYLDFKQNKTATH